MEDMYAPVYWLLVSMLENVQNFRTLDWLPIMYKQIISKKFKKIEQLISCKQNKQAGVGWWPLLDSKRVGVEDDRRSS